MGLDNAFFIKSKKHPDLAIEIAYFRKFYELNDDLSGGNDTVVEVPMEVLEKLRDKIEPVARYLNSLPIDTVRYYDDNGYPSDVELKFYRNDYCPYAAQSSFMGMKVIRLYERLNTMIEIYDNHKYRNENEIYIAFMTSF